MANPLFNVQWDVVKNKSTFTTKSWNPDTENRLYTEVPGGYTLAVSGTRQGVPYSWSYTALYDGKDHPVHGRPDVDTIEAYKVNDQITIGFFKKNGIEVAGYKRKLDLTGKSLQVVASGLNDDGTVYFDVIEYATP